MNGANHGVDDAAYGSGARGVGTHGAGTGTPGADIRGAGTPGAEMRGDGTAGAGMRGAGASGVGRPGVGGPGFGTEGHGADGFGAEGFGTYGRLRVVVPVLALVAAVSALVTAWPGGVGTPQPVEVVQGASAAGYRLIAGAAAGLPWLYPVLEIVATLGLVALGVVLLAVGWAGRRVPGRVAGVLLGLAATVVAYGCSEAVKLAVDQQRPCRAIDLGLAAICPPTGDWSFPSNHATCAGAIAMALVLIRPRLGLTVGVPLALLVALARVAEGVHYPHDVLAGLICGAAAAAILIPVLTRPLARLPILRPHPTP